MKAGRMKAGRGPVFGEEQAMNASASARRIAVVAVAAFCVAATGLARDGLAAAPKLSKKSNSPAQLRYYGGPKSPMWRSQ
jgi:hypothetical protein